jgi:predicted AAA+ superfamily ATPase
MLNQSEIGRDLGLPQPTIHRWLNLFEISYQLVRLPAYSVNRTKRLMKSPKVYWADTGLALFLAGSGATGAALENIVLGDLLAWRDAHLEQAEVLYWRATTGEEVDFVIEAGGQLLPIEVKSSARARIQDGRHIQTFQHEYGKASRAGLVLHTGNTVEWLAPRVLAAPWWRVL